MKVTLYTLTTYGSPAEGEPGVEILTESELRERQKELVQEAIDAEDPDELSDSAKEAAELLTTGDIEDAWEEMQSSDLKDNLYEGCCVEAHEFDASKLRPPSSLLMEAVDALRLLNGYYNDIAKSNPGFMAKLCLQDYGRMNSALRAVERFQKTHPALWKASELQDKAPLFTITGFSAPRTILNGELPADTLEILKCHGPAYRTHRQLLSLGYKPFLTTWVNILTGTQNALAKGETPETDVHDLTGVFYERLNRGVSVFKDSKVFYSTAGSGSIQSVTQSGEEYIIDHHRHSVEYIFPDVKPITDTP